MQRRERQLARLLRALIACCALIFAGAAPAPPLGPAGDVSGWVIAQVAAPAVSRTAATRDAGSRAARSTAAPAARAAASVAPTFPPPTATPRTLRQKLQPRRDGRHLYLEIQTLLC